MSDKLQQLTDRLYEEGLSKGREEGERILQNAKAEADRLLSDAAQKAASIIDSARREAEGLKSKTESDVRMASSQALQAVRSEIENLLLGGLCRDGVETSLKNPDFLKSVISDVCRNFSATQSSDISLVLPDELKSELEPWVGSELKSLLGKSVTASFSRKVRGGFTIAPSEGGWFISLTDETFNSLISEYMRPVTRKLLFGE